MISEESIDQIIRTAERAIQSAIEAIYEYQKVNSYLPQYYRYPDLLFGGIEEHELYKDLKKKIPAFQWDIKFFTDSSYQTPINYGELLKGEDGRFQINCYKLDGFGEFMQLIKNEQDIITMLVSEKKYIDSAIVRFIANIANRYMYMTKNFQSGKFNCELAKELLEYQFGRLVNKKLNVNICVPICFITFESDGNEIAGGISIIKMSQEFQMSRYNASHFESTAESHVAQCASFMLKLNNFQIDNNDIDAVNNTITNPLAYPRKIIDDFIASIRIATGCNVGYGQLLTEPLGWANEWTTDLPLLYGTNIRAFNPNDVETDFPHYNIYKAKNSDLDLAKLLFSSIRQKRADRKNSKNFSKVFIAIRFLNRCMLREMDEDAALDAVTGIEVLLLKDKEEPIKSNISKRISVVGMKLGQCPYLPDDMERVMKVIYNFRSDVIHGRNSNKYRMIHINKKKIEAPLLAIEFLRYLLLFIITNQKYLMVEEFDCK